MTKPITKFYFVRHAEPNYNNHDDLTRELTSKGLRDRLQVTKFLTNKSIDVIYSSPFKRAIDTVKHFADSVNLPVHLEDRFRERRIDSIWIKDFDAFTQKQWSDFSYKLSDGESLGQVQTRNIDALNVLLKQHKGQNIVIGSHGTALSTIVNYYQPTFTLKNFTEIKHLFPFVIELTFVQDNCTNIVLYDILKEPPHEAPLL
ncbi:histidine phosphatase family protein [Streptococcus ovuberis]|uniref:histidine phosphatase family protein n=1 Tax=Streptococcus ovuberis TaxID=1936207 RepID=UPI0031B5C6F3